ncbi:gamma-B protein [Poa semilatent virus]|uniref:Gamma-B protein n=1 Tax=Poa semilatent virus TaxID=12328 RepID=Q02475_9VIRU|nr:gamma-B protein [Poa semilatent virus]AAB05619.1 gamma-B protein [Poa semilatent virus]QEG59346.1 gamma B protein [Poa semilatent virus]
MSTDLCSVCGNVKDVSTFVESQEDGKFCSAKCLRKATFRRVRKQLAEEYLKHDLIPVSCQLNSFPGYHCGMISALEMDPSGKPVVMNFCGQKHEALALALKAKDGAKLRLEYLERRFYQMKDVYARRLDRIAENLKEERNRLTTSGTITVKRDGEESKQLEVSVPMTTADFFKLSKL